MFKLRDELFIFLNDHNNRTLSQFLASLQVPDLLIGKFRIWKEDVGKPCVIYFCCFAADFLTVNDTKTQDTASGVR